MFEKTLDKLFPKKWVIVNMGRGGCVGDNMNLVPYKRHLTKSQNKKKVRVYYPWKDFPKNYFSHWSTMPNHCRHFDDLMMLNTYRFKWKTKWVAKKLFKQSQELSILGIGEIIREDYLAYATPLPYYVTHIRDLLVSRKKRVYSVVQKHASSIPVPLNYWFNIEYAEKYIDRIKTLINSERNPFFHKCMIVGIEEIPNTYPDDNYVWYDGEYHSAAKQNKYRLLK